MIHREEIPMGVCLERILDTDDLGGMITMSNVVWATAVHALALSTIPVLTFEGLVPAEMADLYRELLQKLVDIPEDAGDDDGGWVEFDLTIREILLLRTALIEHGQDFAALQGELDQALTNSLLYHA